MEQPIEIFCCSADIDQSYLKKIQQQLIQSVKKGIVTLWDESMIPAGSPRNLEIERHLESARIFLLLISAEFLASEYCYEKVTKEALVKHVDRNAIVIPVIVRPANWETSELQGIQVLPRDMRPINAHDLPEQDDLINKVAAEITNIIQRSLSSNPGPFVSHKPIPAQSSPNNVFLPPPSSPHVLHKPIPAQSSPNNIFLPPPPSPWRRIILLVALLLSLAIVFGGIGITFYMIQQNQFRAQATATVQASLTGTAQAQLTGTVQANATAIVVLITSPVDGSTVERVITVQGTAYNIPNGEALWILVVPAGINAYYPQSGPVVITGNKWTSSATIGIPSDHGLGFTLIVAVVDQNGSTTFSEYLNQSNQSGSYKGLASLPNGVVSQSQIHVTRK